MPCSDILLFWPLLKPFSLNADEGLLNPSIPDVASRVEEVFCVPGAAIQTLALNDWNGPKGDGPF
jgi:hypothetical protein